MLTSLHILFYLISLVRMEYAMLDGNSAKQKAGVFSEQHKNTLTIKNTHNKNVHFCFCSHFQKLCVGELFFAKIYKKDVFYQYAK